MGKLGWVFGLSAVLLAGAVAHAAPPEKTASGSLVIVFKDGHRQTFSLAEVDRVEYPAGTMAAADLGSANKQAPPRGRFIGKWECGDGNGGTFYITLNENGDAYRSLHEVRGHWVYFNGDALITWDDGAQDAIRRVGSRFQKFAYSAGKRFTDEPDNVAEARNTSPRPI
ncbi:MAG TPA: hypothetical protein VGJ21_02810 [Terracidiphilus sp.]